MKMWSAKKYWRAMRAIGPFTRPYRTTLIVGILATVGVVVLRLALPWPLRGVMEVVFALQASSSDAPGFLVYVPASLDPIFAMGLVYVALAVAVGVHEWIQRVNIKRFAARSVHDMRGDALAGAVADPRGLKAGELIARIVGDSARIREGFSGVVLHLGQHALLAVGACAIMVWLAPALGLVMALAGALACSVGFVGALIVARTMRKQRQKEAILADAILAAVDSSFYFKKPGRELDETNQQSARNDVKMTRQIASTCLVIHTMMGVMVALGLWIGTSEIRSGTMAAGDLFVFVAYAITIHYGTVRMGRQLARSGKVVACIKRIADLLETPPAPPPPAVPQTSAAPASETVPPAGMTETETTSDTAPATASGTVSVVTAPSGTTATPPAGAEHAAWVELQRVSLRSAVLQKSRIRKLSVSVPAGSKIAVVGGMGAGKSSLLRLLAGLERPNKGVIQWPDASAAEAVSKKALPTAYLAQNPTFLRGRVWQLLRLENGPASLTAEQETLLRQIGAWKLIERLERGLEQKVGSSQFSKSERRVLNLAAIVLNDSPVWLLDDPTDGLDRKAARKRMKAILNHAADRVVIVTFSRPVRLKRFDHVWEFKRGKLRFSGSPAEWKALAGETSAHDLPPPETQPPTASDFSSTKRYETALE